MSKIVLACVSIGRARDLAAAPGAERETGKEGFDGDDQWEAGTGCRYEHPGLPSERGIFPGQGRGGEKS
mgnify:CR=1 FL=1